jgi:hypothetical protein
MQIEVFVHKPVCEPLGGHIANWEFGEHNFGSTLVDLLQLVVENCPLGIDHLIKNVDQSKQFSSRTSW